VREVRRRAWGRSRLGVASRYMLLNAEPAVHVVYSWTLTRQTTSSHPTNASASMAGRRTEVSVAGMRDERGRSEDGAEPVDDGRRGLDEMAGLRQRELRMLDRYFLIVDRATGEKPELALAHSQAVEQQEPSIREQVLGSSRELASRRKGLG
jgi:hypothetical protein